MATYNSGGANVVRSHNFISSQELHKPHIQSKLVQRFNETLTGFLDLAGAKAATDSIEYSRFEKNRVMPKIKATNGGAGAAGAAVAFTVHADAKTDFGSYSPYDTGVTATTKGMPVRLYDVVQIRPAAGTLASAGNYITGLVTAVTNNTAFTVTPLNSADAIPSIAAAQEIIIIGNMNGEGTGFQKSLSTKVTKYTENLQILKSKYEVTGTEKLQALWIDMPAGDRKAFLPGEADGYMTMLKLVDTTCLVGEAVSNTANISELFVDGTLETDAPISGTNGVITQALDGGNTLNYASLTGVTLADLYDYNTVIDKESADKTNMLNLGIDLDQQLDRELGDRVSNGAISYGVFNFDAEKAIALNFNKVRLGAYTYEKRCLDAMNDPQVLGADGFGYSYEGLMLPMGMSKVAGGSEAGAMIPTLRKRFLANKGVSREMEVNYFEGLSQSDSGLDKDEVRYLSHVGVELQAKNKSGYWKRA
jgi:hypothetical protein